MGNSNIIFVGTGHILERSVKEVEEVIEKEKPDVVAVELCKSRYEALKENLGSFSIKEAITCIGPVLGLTFWLLSYVQRKMGEDFDIEPGAEMVAAIKKAEEQGCKIALVDRDILITMMRFWRKMRFFEKIKMLSSIVFAIIGIGRGVNKKEKKLMDIEMERITDDDVVSELLEELREFSPGAVTTLLDERDAYIAGSLLEISKMSLKAESKSAGEGEGEGAADRKIVAVVGAGHVFGIKKYLSQPELIPPKKELCSLPKKRFSFSIKVKKFV